MKQNEARPLFRVLSGVLALFIWSSWVLLLFFVGARSESVEWQLLVGMPIFALPFTITAIKGYTPYFVWRLMPFWSSAVDKKDLK